MRRAIHFSICICLTWAASARATWSIVAADTRTREVAVGSATCLTSFDLRAITPVVLVGVGGAAVQSAGDFDGIRRPVIHREFRNGTASTDILTTVSLIGGHQSRQYGIADTGGDAATFTGSANGAHASGAAGVVGTIHYAIQGNVLTGRPVVLEAERAFVDTPGDLAEKLMAAMEAARRMGGDGRCSCSPNNPPGCGSPPPNFNKTAHIGYMIVARLGDVDGQVCDRGGCARGEYFMNFNVPFQNQQSPDPVFQLQEMFDEWRADLLGRPDAVQSKVSIEEKNGVFEMNVELFDWQSSPLGRSAEALKVEHAPGSAEGVDIGEVIDHGDGTYQVTLTPNDRLGIDRFQVSVDDGGDRPIVLSPLPELRADACDVRVKQLKAKSTGVRLRVTARLLDGGGDPAPDHELLVKIGRRNNGPLLKTLGVTNSRGRAHRTFQEFNDHYQAHVIAVLPPDPPGGQCLDPDRPRQRLHSNIVKVP